jgi:hypothetical protein
MTFETDPRSYALDLADQGLSSAHLLLCALKYMSHDDVRGMLDANELSPRFLEEEDEEERLEYAAQEVTR